jgi:hypothetical protein
MITDVVAAILNVARGVSLIVTAVDPPPPTILPGMLPCAFVITGKADDTEDNADYTIEIRQYHLRVAILQTGEASPYDRESKCRDILDAVKVAFRSAPGLGGTRWVQRCSVLSDSGIGILPEYEEGFVGFEVILEVLVYVPRTYRSGE